ncbi:MAG: VWA domain-containing protein [Halieaceae bacterium]|nr:VWA domain-containing protein [Halieaceae bacterium]
MTTLWHIMKRSAGVIATALATVQGTQAAGLMTPANGSLPALEIRQHHVDVLIEDGYAITTVDQVFFNPHSQALEATYSFPVPEQAAVGDFTYWIDDQPVTGEVLEQAEARSVYEQEKAQGRETALTEQDEYRSFDSSVYPVLPQDSVKIRLVYIQPVHVDLNIGRYVYPLEEGGVDEEKLAFWTYNDVVTEDFSFNLRMRSSYPIDSFRLPQHPQAVVSQESDQVWTASLANVTPAADVDTPEADYRQPTLHRLDQDIVVYWRHQQGLPGSIDMITHKPAGSDRGTFMMTITPGDDLGAITGGRDWVFVLDLSGSMQGKYQTLVEGVNKGLARLAPNDRFRIVLFNNRAWELTSGYIPVTEGNITRHIQQLEQTNPANGTNLYAGLEKGIKGLDADRPSAILLVTDGVANVGITQKKDFLDLLEEHDVRLYSFVMGNSANRPLLEGMTKVSNGFAMNISNSDDIVGRLVQTTDKLKHEAYRDIDIDIDGVKVRDMTPARIGSLYRGQQLVVFGHYWGEGQAEITIKGKVSAQDRVYSSRINFPAQTTLYPEIERLWAFASIEGLQNRIDYLGEDPDSRQAIVDLALEYGLVTDYTSMVVVRDAVKAQYGIDQANADRVAAEHNARQQRSTGAVRKHRQDTQQPAFNSPRAQPANGGGALGPWAVLLILPLLLLGSRSRQG